MKEVKDFNEEATSFNFNDLIANEANVGMAKSATPLNSEQQKLREIHRGDFQQVKRGYEKVLTNEMLRVHAHEPTQCTMLPTALPTENQLPMDET